MLYLGSIMSIDGGTNKDFNYQLEMAAAVFQQVRPIWSTGAISTTTKNKTLQECCYIN